MECCALWCFLRPYFTAARTNAVKIYPTDVDLVNGSSGSRMPRGGVQTGVGVATEKDGKQRWSAPTWGPNENHVLRIKPQQGDKYVNFEIWDEDLDRDDFLGGRQVSIDDLLSHTKGACSDDECEWGEGAWKGRPAHPFRFF